MKKRSDDVTKIKVCEMMGEVGISRKNKVKNVHLLKISLLTQIGGKI